MTSAATETDVCVLGAGPHGLAMATHLAVADPTLDVTVLDHADRWLATWNTQFERAEITTLRSPIVHHPAPDPFALDRFVSEFGLARSGLPYDLPTIDAFAQFCAAMIEHLDLAPPRATPAYQIRSDGRSVRLETGDGTLTARHLIIAANPHQRPIPDWVWPILGREPGLVTHGYDVDLRAQDDLTGRTVVVIGGGLTAAHLAHGAATRGAHVQLISRRNLSVRSFDTAPGWLGPKYLTAFDAEAVPARRLSIAGRARSGGSIPEWMHTRLGTFDGPGSVDLCEATVVREAEILADGGCVLDLSNGAQTRADHVWLAIGTQPDAYGLKALHSLLADVACINGYPIIDRNLQLGPHPAFVMGRLATIALGPAAGNLWGAQRAAHRITQAITGVDLASEPTSLNRASR
ncbi:MAG: FAD-dependent oxidoreductase [Actinomycetota bacterium]